jgi:hypothetical protein
VDQVVTHWGGVGGLGVGGSRVYGSGRLGLREGGAASLASGGAGCMGGAKGGPLAGRAGVAHPGVVPHPPTPQADAPT